MGNSSSVSTENDRSDDTSDIRYDLDPCNICDTDYSKKQGRNQIRQIKKTIDVWTDTTVQVQEKQDNSILGSTLEFSKKESGKMKEILEKFLKKECNSKNFDVNVLDTPGKAIKHLISYLDTVVSQNQNQFEKIANENDGSVPDERKKQFKQTLTEKRGNCLFVLIKLYIIDTLIGILLDLQEKLEIWNFVVARDKLINLIFLALDSNNSDDGKIDLGCFSFKDEEKIQKEMTNYFESQSTSAFISLNDFIERFKYLQAITGLDGQNSNCNEAEYDAYFSEFINTLDANIKNDNQEYKLNCSLLKVDLLLTKEENKNYLELKDQKRSQINLIDLTRRCKAHFMYYIQDVEKPRITCISFYHPKNISRGVYVKTETGGKTHQNFYGIAFFLKTIREKLKSSR